eukprot:354988-Chlamydomonas_euryale.AAC.17
MARSRPRVVCVCEGAFALYTQICAASSLSRLVLRATPDAGALSVVGRSAPACVPQSAAGMCFQLTMSPVADASRLSLSCPPRTLAHAAASSSRPAAGAWQGNAPQSYGHANRVRYMPLAAINAAPGMTNTAAVAPDGDGQPADGPFNSLRLWLQQQFLKLPMLRPLVAPLARAVLEDDIATEADELQERMMVPERGHAVMPVIDLKRQKKLKPPGKLSREDRALWELFRVRALEGGGRVTAFGIKLCGRLVGNVVDECADARGHVTDEWLGSRLTQTVTNVLLTRECRRLMSMVMATLTSTRCSMFFQS